VTFAVSPVGVDKFADPNSNLQPISANPLCEWYMKRRPDSSCKTALLYKLARCDTADSETRLRTYDHQQSRAQAVTSVSIRFYGDCQLPTAARSSLILFKLQRQQQMIAALVKKQPTTFPAKRIAQCSLHLDPNTSHEGAENIFSEMQRELKNLPNCKAVKIRSAYFQPNP
jgi:hypothetical protein